MTRRTRPFSRRSPLLRGLPWALSVLAPLGCHGGAASAPTATVGAATTAGGVTANARCPADMVLVAAGEFTMGTDRRTSMDAAEPHRELVARAYCVERTEVSVAAYRRCTAAGACPEPEPFLDQHGDARILCNWNRPGADQHPVNCVTWAKAQAYCAWSGHDGGARRLLTDVEWEFAARGSAGRTYAWGDELSGGERGNLCGAECAEHLHTLDFPAITALSGWTDRSPLTSPVDAHPEGATPEGVLNLTGNVGEWVAGRYHGGASPYGELEASESGEVGLIRGGSFMTMEMRSVHAAARRREILTSYEASAGLRCARDAR